MKTFIVFALFVVAAMAFPGDREAQVLKYENSNIGTDEGYQYKYETENGIRAQQDATWTNAGTDNEALVVRGEYSYVAPDGQTYTVTYTADENGYHPSAPFLPK